MNYINGIKSFRSMYLLTSYVFTGTSTTKMKKNADLRIRVSVTLPQNIKSKFQKYRAIITILLSLDISDD